MPALSADPIHDWTLAAQMQTRRRRAEAGRLADERRGADGRMPSGDERMARASARQGMPFQPITDVVGSRWARLKSVPTVYAIGNSPACVCLS